MRWKNWHALIWEHELRFTYDRGADAAKFYFIDLVAAGGVARSHICDVELSECAVVLDFDDDSRLIGVEILGASRILPEQMLGGGSVAP